MADIAFVFGWEPTAMDAMPLAEIMQWRERAIERFNTANKVTK